MDHCSKKPEATPEPTTDLGRAVRDLVRAAPQFVATLQSAPPAKRVRCDADEDDEVCHEEHACGCGRSRRRDYGAHGCHGDCLDQPLRTLIVEIGDDIDKKRNPAGVVANCNDALKRLAAAYGELNGVAEPQPATRREPSFGVLVLAVLVAIALVAGGFLMFGAGADIVYPSGSDPDYRQLAYPAAVDAPNLGVALAWIILVLAAVGAAIWLANRVVLAGAPRPLPHEGEHAGLRSLYDRGFISRDMYDRGRRLASDDPLVRPAAGEAYAREYAAYVVALADALCHRRSLDTVARYRQEQKLAEPSSLFGGPARAAH